MIVSDQEIERKIKLQEEYNGVLKPINKTDVLLSVWVTTYQHEKYIKECLDGILMQKTNFNFEIVVGEDQSADNTRAICIEYANKYPDKIRLFLRDRNLTVIKDDQGKFIRSLNGLFTNRSCRGKYIALCEGDDFWTDPLKLQKQVDFLQENKEFAICGTYLNVLNNNKLEKYPNECTFEIFNFYDIIESNKIHTATMCYIKNNDIVNNIVKNYEIGDLPLLLELLKNGNKLAKLPFNSAVYRYHGKGANSGKTRFQNTLIHFKVKLKFSKTIKNKKFKNKLKLYFLKTGIIEIKNLLMGYNYDLKILKTGIIYFFKI